MKKIEELEILLEAIDTKSCVIRFTINGSWTTDDFIKFFKSLNTIYKFNFWTYKAFKLAKVYISKPENKKIKFDDFSHTPLSTLILPLIEEIKSSNKIKPPRIQQINLSNLLDFEMLFDNLSIAKISYASPGITDIVGISGILKQIKEILFHYFPNKTEKEKAEILKQQRIEMQIKNLKTIGFSDLEIKSVLLTEEKSIVSLGDFLESGLIEKIELVEISK